jgi:CheY-like chemotaxis protein
MKTVLVIDDNDHIQSTLKTVLSNQYKVTQVQRLKEVREILKLGAPKVDVILAARFLKQTDITCLLVNSLKKSRFSNPVIALWNESEDMEVQLEKGFTDEISKTNLGLTTIRLNKIMKDFKTKAL